MYDLELGLVESVGEKPPYEGVVLVLNVAGEQTGESLIFNAKSGDYVTYDYDENEIDFALGVVGGIRHSPAAPVVREQIAFERDQKVAARIRKWCPSANWLAQR